MKLNVLTGSIPGQVRLVGDQNTEISNICIDSRKVQPGDLFICTPGLRMDAHKFAPQAVESGAPEKDAAQQAAQAAWKAFEDTKGMLAKQGRMAIRGEQSRELLDPGAAVAALLMKGYAEYKADSE